MQIRPLPLLLCLCLAGACASGQGRALPLDVVVGDISGQSAEIVSRALKARASAKAGGAVLSGRVSFNQDVARGTETVPEEVPAGRPVPTWKPDPFTRRVWLEDIIPTAFELKTYNLEQLSGRLIFDWRLTSPNGAVSETGRVDLPLDRVRGGYLASEGAAPTLSDAAAFNPRGIERRLADELAGQLALTLGRALRAGDLEDGGDELSRQAKRLAGAGDWEGAKALWQELLRLNPQYAPAHFNLGLYWESRREPETAWRCYRDAFNSDASRRHRAALTRLTETLARAGRRPERQ